METIPFTIALIVIYIYITKEVQNLFIKNQKARFIKDLNKRKGILWSWIGRFHFKMARDWICVYCVSFIANSLPTESSGKPIKMALFLQFLYIYIYIQCNPWASQVALVVKNLDINTGDIRDTGLIPGLGRSPGEGHGNPLQYSCLESPMDRGAWQATVGLQRARCDWSSLAHRATPIRILAVFL